MSFLVTKTFESAADNEEKQNNRAVMQSRGITVLPLRRH